MLEVFIENFGLLIISISFFIAFYLNSIKNKKIITKFFISVAAIYVFLVISIFSFDLFLSAKLQTFDLNNDGVFSPSEATEEQVYYQRLVINDLGRNLSIITSFAISFIVSLIVMIAFRIKDYFK